MRTVARYSIRASVEEGAEALSFQRLQAVVQDWLDRKGEWLEGQDGFLIEYPDGRVARLASETTESAAGKIERNTLREPTDSGEFETALSIAQVSGAVLMFGELRAGNPGSVVAPVSFDVRTPRVVQSMLAVDLPWRVGRTEVGVAPMRFLDRPGGAEFGRLIQDGARDVPVVAVSELEGFLMQPDLDRKLAQDLCGVAVVAKLDDRASRALTTECGAPWSCYNGAVRIYWPRLKLGGDPFKHPFWTADRLTRGRSDGDALRDAAFRVRRLIRRRILSTSSLSIEEPSVFAEIRSQRIDEMRDLSDLEGVLKIVEGERDSAREELREARTLIERLQTDIDNLELRLQHASAPQADEDEVVPDTEIAPASVREAVEIAQSQLSEDLVFGAAVADGVRTVAEDAGPPEKVLRFLRTLADMTKMHRKDGGLGLSIAAWLSQRNCASSIESETIRNNDREMGKRTWDDGAGKLRQFELHMKPAEATSPDRCVRIYFDYDVDRGRTVVGWIGRHP